MKTRLLLTLTALLLALSSWANGTEIDGMHYNLNFSKKTASVTYTGSSSSDNTYTGSIIIPASVYYRGNIYSVTNIGDWAFKGCTGLTSITIPSSVTSIGGSSVFSGCSGLTSITIPSSVTSIGGYAFSGCTGLTSVTIPESVTIIREGAFSGCTSLTSVTLNSNTIASKTYTYSSSLSSIFGSQVKEYILGDEVKKIGDYAFSGCTGIPSITIPSSVTSIGQGAFYDCTSLTRVNITDIAAWCGISFYNSTSNPLYYSKRLYLNGKEVTSVTIPSSVTNIGSYAFSGCTGLTSITIPSSVTSIRNGAFYGCTGLTSITIPESVTRIGNYTFYECTGLTSITIPNSVTTIGESAFCGCTGLTSITIPSSVTSIGDYAFSRCTGLTSVTINSNDVVSKAYTSSSNLSNIFGKQVKEYIIGEAVTSIGDWAFRGCSGLTSINIPSSVTSIESSAFAGCTGLTSITIPNSVTSIGNEAFMDCSGLTSVTINSNDVVSKAYTSSSNLSNIFGKQVKEYIIGEAVTSIGSAAFRDCTGLTSITIPSSVTSIESSAFAGCTGLTSITIPNSVTTIGGGAFSRCSGLTSIKVEAGNTEYDSRDNSNAIIETASNTLVAGCKNTTIPNSVTTIGGSAFSSCSALTSITIPNSVTSIGGSAFSGCSRLTSLTIGNSVTSIGDHAFYGCTGLRSITIPNSVTSIGGYAFSFCDGLTSVTIPNSVTTIGYEAFSRCSGLRSITIGNSVTSIGDHAFSGCSSLTSLTIPNSVTTIGDYAFSFCDGLTSVTIPNSVTTIGYRAFFDCTGLTSITIGNSVTTIGESAFSFCSGLTSVTINTNDVVSKAYTSSSNLSNIFGKQVKEYIIGEAVTTIGESAFNGCTGLTSITIPNSVTSIGNYAFSSCYGLTSITIPNSVTTIGSSAFRDCSGLTSITIPKSVTTIGSEAFRSCTGLTSITIPNSVTSIGGYAFSGCIGLTSVTIPNSVTTIGGSAFSSCSALTSITIPNSVTSIGGSAFYNCSGLTSITIPNSVTSIGNYAFYGCTGLTSVTINSNDVVSKAYTSSSNLSNIFGTQVKEYIIGEAVTTIGEYTFYNCSRLTSITIPSSVTSIGNAAFSGCTGLTSVTLNSNTIASKTYTSSSSLSSIFGNQVKEYILGDEIKSIGSYAFYNCSGLTSITIPSSVTSIGVNAFPTSCKLYVSNIGPTVLAIWEKSYTVYDLSTRKVIQRPTLSCSTTQSTATFKMENYNNNFSYKVDNTVVTNSNSIKLTGLKPGSTGTESLYAKHKNASRWYNIGGCSYTTSNISPTTTSRVTPSSVTLTPSYIKGDANVTSQKLTINGTTQNVEAGKTYTITGLNPGKEYPVVYTIIANGSTFTYNGTAKTPALTMATQQPKVISAGNVIVAAETNLDEAETNVGFEWRRTDWTDDFASNSGAAYLYAGTMEGYIRNLYTEKLWKYRPYYEASDGTRYYGDWVGLDPTNTSYFEPTVHTYATINVQSNTASVKGYAMRGTDNVAQQGFKYWKVSSSTRGLDEAGSRLMALDIPAYAQTITASGQVMTATLTNLEYASDYCCVAFVTTTEGETFYGELQTFRTGEDVTGIGHVVINATDEASGTPTIVGYYNLQGQRIAEPQKGIVIVRYSDGTSRKMYVR